MVAMMMMMVMVMRLVVLRAMAIVGLLQPVYA